MMRYKYAVIHIPSGKVELIYDSSRQQALCNAWRTEDYIQFRIQPQYLEMDLEVCKWDSGFVIDENLVTERQTKRWDDLRIIRDEYLKATDYTQIDDYSLGLSDMEISKYADYRAYLRELPNNVIDIDSEYESCKSFEEWSI